MRSCDRNYDPAICSQNTANEGALPLELVNNSAAHDAWFRAKVMQALEDTRPDVEDCDAETHFAKRREEALHKVAAGE